MRSRALFRADSGWNPADSALSALQAVQAVQCKQSRCTTVGYSLRNRYRFLTAIGGKTTGNGDGGVA